MSGSSGHPCGLSYKTTGRPGGTQVVGRGRCRCGKWSVCWLQTDGHGSQPQGSTTRSVQPLPLQQELLRVTHGFKMWACYSVCASSMRAWMTRSYFSGRSSPANQRRQRTLVKAVLLEVPSPCCGRDAALVVILPCSLCLRPVSHEAGSRVWEDAGGRGLEYSERTSVITVPSIF